MAATEYPRRKQPTLKHVIMLASKVTGRSKSGQSRLSCTAALFSKVRSVSLRLAGTGMHRMCTCAWLPSRRLSAPCIWASCASTCSQPAGSSLLSL